MNTVRAIIAAVCFGIIAVGVGIFVVGAVVGIASGGDSHTVVVRHATKAEHRAKPHVKQVNIDAYDPLSAEYECRNPDNPADTRSQKSWKHSWWAANRYACAHDQWHDATTARLIFGDGELRGEEETQAHEEHRVCMFEVKHGTYVKADFAQCVSDYRKAGL
jgi:hypothetical protein